MKIAAVALVGMGVVSCVTVAEVQQGATVVQLPTLRYFAVDTTVSVPTGGAAMLGGTARGARGGVRRGVPWAVPVGPRQMGIGRSVGSTSVHVTAYGRQDLDSRWHPRSTTRAADLFPETLWIRGSGQGRDAEAVARRVAEVRRRHAGE